MPAIKDISDAYTGSLSVLKNVDNYGYCYSYGSYSPEAEALLDVEAMKAVAKDPGRLDSLRCCLSSGLGEKLSSSHSKSDVFCPVIRALARSALIRIALL